MVRQLVATAVALIIAWPAWPVTWDFEQPGDTQGWVALEGPSNVQHYPNPPRLQSEVTRGVWRIRLPAHRPGQVPSLRLLSLPLGYDSALLDRLVVRLRVVHAQPVSGTWRLTWSSALSDLAADVRTQRYRFELEGRYSYTTQWQELTIGDLRERPVVEGQVRPLVGWGGLLREVSLTLSFATSLADVGGPESVPEAVEIDWIRLTGARELEGAELPPPTPDPEPGPGSLLGTSVFSPLPSGGIRYALSVPGTWGETTAALGDLDADGDLDLVLGMVDHVVSGLGVASRVDRRGWLLYERATQRFLMARVEELAEQPRHYETGADVDGDGRMEALVSASPGGALVRWSAAGPALLQEFPAQMVPLGLGDWDGDGKADGFMVDYAQAPPSVALFTNDGTGRLSGPVTLRCLADPGAFPVRLVRRVGGPRSDGVLWTAWGEEGPYWATYRDRDGDTVEQEVTMTIGYRQIRYAGDYDGDTDIDVVAVDEYSAALARARGLSYWVNDGSGRLRRLSWLPDYAPPAPEYFNVGMWDLNGDGVLDPVLVDPDIRGNSVLVGLGRPGDLPVFEGRYPVVEGAGGRVLGGDVDGDGDTDVVVAHTSPGIHVLLNRTVAETAVGEVGTAPPGVFALSPAYPNPFNPQTSIPFEVPQGAGTVTLAMFNVLGQPVRTLLAGRLAAGPHVVSWDGRDAQGRDVAAGVFLYRLQAGSWQRTGKVVKVD